MGVDKVYYPIVYTHLVRESILNYINTTPHYNLSVIINLIKDLRLLALLLAIFIKRLTNYASNICGLNILIPDTLVRFTTLRIIFIAPFKSAFIAFPIDEINKPL